MRLCADVLTAQSQGCIPGHMIPHLHKGRSWIKTVLTTLNNLGEHFNLLKIFTYNIYV
jgi:hypothetical protein